MYNAYKNTSVKLLENLPYGSHICLLYQNKEDLIDILVPYFIEGLQNNEYCMWITSKPLHAKEAEIVLRECLSSFDQYVKKNQIEIIPFNNWYLKGNEFNFHYIFNKLNDKVSYALDRGFNGLRLSGNISWLRNEYLNDFKQYERAVNDVITLYKIIALCTYPLREYNTFKILDVICNHQFSITKYENSWKIIKPSMQNMLERKLIESEEHSKSLNDNPQATIPKQEKIRQQLRDYKTFLSNIFTSIQDGICIIDNQLNITFVNPKMEEWYPHMKLLQGKKCYEVFYQRSKPCEDCKCMSIIKGGEMCCILNVQKEIEGNNVKYFNVYNYPFLDQETGEINGIIKYIRDETKYTTVKRKLKEFEDKYRHIFNNSPLGIGIANMSGTVIAMNKKMEELTGFNIIELNDIGLEATYVDQYVRDELTKIVEEQGFVRDYEIKKKRKDETHYLASLNIDLINIQGEPLLHTTIRDISYQKLPEKKLKESEVKFRSFVESTPVATFLYQDYECIYANPAATTLTEYSLKELESMKFWDFVHPDYKNIIINIGKALEKNEPFKLVDEIKIITKSGFEKWINGKMVLIEYGGRRAALISAIDITEKKKAETEFIKLNELKSALLRRVSHELKTPLVSIKGNANLLLERYFYELNYNTITIIEDIKNGCERLETLVKDLLETLRLEANQIMLNVSYEDLAFLIKFCVRKFKDLIKGRNHKIILEIQDRLMTNFEKERIFKVITNLLSNAIKYTQPNGIIKIKSEIKDNFYIISIQDNGIGFTKEEKEGIFEQFGKIERYGQGLDVISEGTGLGLYISKKIVELHGGKMWMESEGRFKGSTFYFSLPIIKD